MEKKIKVIIHNELTNKFITYAFTESEFANVDNVKFLFDDMYKKITNTVAGEKE